ncbi:MAG TPA: Cys-tRNA(Pro) deacylase [Holophaga sp.]|nr:Cys-tRNA(Pro) deacylase [Holophaga sp.]
MTKTPSTPAIRQLKENKVPFEEHLYRYEEHGGTKVCAREFQVEEHTVIKTLIMEDENAKPLVVLMHGDLEVSTKSLARQIGCKAIQICKPEVANRHSGYQVGGTSPFGTRRAMPVYMERSILDLGRIFINGGSRGLLVSMDPKDAAMVLNPVLVEVSQRE